jgi:histidine ammonia-lyase
LYSIEPTPWKIETVSNILKEKISLGKKSVSNINACRAFLEKKMSEPNATFYGINTGFGSLCNVRIEASELSKLQYNLVVSHACGLGDEVPQAIVKIMLLLKIKNFVYGNSGVRLQLVQRLVDMYNADMLPVVFTLGSLGASGDLAPLAHLSLPLLNLGEVYYKGKKMSSQKANKLCGWEPLTLQSKEGLALLNGTQFMSAYGTYTILQSKQMINALHNISALSTDVWDCVLQPFDANIHIVRSHKGQQIVAKNILQNLKGSALQKQKKVQVQDPYSFRCMPQVHGASIDTITHITQIVETEINSVTDNPLIFPKENKILSGGNFHGQPMAINLDFLAIALAELANISERRIYLLISGQRNLPAFLVRNAGLESGFMIAQYTAASIVSQSKQLCTPASVDSIVSSNGQEDHVSMGANAATKLVQVLENTWRVLGIEWLTAVYALQFRRPLKTSMGLEKLVAAYSKKNKIVLADKYMHDYMKNAIAFVKSI